MKTKRINQPQMPQMPQMHTDGHRWTQIDTDVNAANHRIIKEIIT
jgi:hypothetical protein